MAQIKTFARLKPSKKAYPGYEISKNVLTVHIPDNKDFQQVIRSNLSYDIVFTDIFRPEATQDEVFDGVAKDIIQNFLNGYNGTIFAYGQTGTGKTYTVEGNTSRYSTRGLATRALSMIYQQLESRADEHISVYLSYLEIYQEVAYDLLNPASRTSLPVAPFAKVTVVEGPRGSCILRGLSLHLAANEEIAQMLLLQGQANRKVAETPVNQRSSRSHAVFTVYLQVRKHDSEVLVNSKLHLVDLAGSERVSKTGVDGQQLTEAKSINLSLHHLETVIIALQTERGGSGASSSGSGDKSKGEAAPLQSRGGEKGKGEVAPLQSRSNTSFMSGPSSDNGTKPYKFVPYRNSLLTMVLKDSLGGNCLTAMIATISMDPENLGESISTCRFAQRVARIANNARRNEEVDDKTLIKRLKHKVAYLENQVALLRSKGRSDPITDEEILDVLTEEDRIACAKIMEGFLQGVITDPVDAGICDQCRFRECLHLLKHQYLTSQSSDGQIMLSTPPLAQHQWRPEGAETLTDHTSHLRPNNPHIDSGDHIMSTSQGASLLPVSTQRPPLTSSSEIDISTADHYAKENGTEGNRSRAETASASEKHSTDIDQLLEVCGKDMNKSPYERKRVKEMKKLGHKLTTLEQEQMARQEHLDQMRQDSRMQELLAAENSLRLKLQVADQQVADQHAYILQLKHMQAEQDVIAKEQLVEEQLLKRQGKFQEKLKGILDSKAELERDVSLKADISHGSSKKLLEEKLGQYKLGKGSLNTRQVYDLLKNEEKKQQKESLKMEREKTSGKTKQLALKEATTLEKLRQLKQMLRMSQQQGDPDYIHEPFEKGPGEYNIQRSYSIESNQSVRGEESFSRFTNCDLKMNPEHESQLHHDQTWTHSRISSNRNTSRIRNAVVHSDTCHSSDDKTKDMQEYLKQVLSGAYLDKLANEMRQSMQDTDLLLSEDDGFYFLPNNDPPFSKGPVLGKNNPVTGRQGNTTANASPTFNTVLQSSPAHEGTWPMEVRSFHDPRHSHKFAFDNRPFESTSLNTPKKNDAESLYNNNNTYILNSSNSTLQNHYCLHSSNNTLQNHYLHNSNNAMQNHCLLHNLNYNTNANNGVPEDSEIKQDVFDVGPSAFSQDQLNLLMGSCVDYAEGSSVSNMHLKPGSDQDKDKVLVPENVMGLENVISSQSKSDSSDHWNNTSILGASMSLPSQSQTIGMLKSTGSEPGSARYTETPHHPTLMPSEYVNFMSSHDKFDARKIGLSSQTFDSALSHMLGVEDQKNGPSLPHKSDPYAEYIRSSKISEVRFIGRNQSKAPARNFSQEQRKSRRKDLSDSPSPERKPVSETKMAWGPELKNSSIADRLTGLFDTYPSTIPALSYAEGCEANFRKTKIIPKNRPVYDNLQAQIALYKDIEDIKDDDFNEDDSFFGLQPEKTKIQALTLEEGERTFMSAVAAEKARVEKIRKARAAAEVIQRSWRAFRARQ